MQATGTSGATAQMTIAGEPAVRLDRYDQGWFDRGRSALVVAAWDLVQTFLVHPSPHAAYAWRRALYRLFGARIGRGVLLRKSVRCNYPWKVAIGDHAWIGDEATLYALERIEIGEHAVVSQQAYICTGTHDHADPAFGLVVKPVRIERCAWIALGALVMPGATVGEGAVVAARAVLTRDAQPWTVYRGVPAAPCGRREIRSAPPTA